MQWMTDNVAWILSALIFFVVVWVIVFFARNAAAKSEINTSANSNPKIDGTIAIQKNLLQRIKK